MKKIFIITLLLLISCKKNNCEGYACFTPPPDFIFELVDSSTGENLFTNNTLNSNEITFITATNSAVEFTFIAENNLNLIQANGIGWNLGINTYKLTVGSVTIDLLVEMKEINENCCTYFEIVTFEVSNYNFEKSNTTGITKIIID